MAFRFSFEVLLRVRQSLERQQELRLQTANLRVAALRQHIEDVRNGMEKIAVRRRDQMASGASAAELQFDLLCRTVLTEQQHVVGKQLAEAEVFQHSCRDAFQLARRQREVVDTLRHHQLQLYRQQESRQEQRRLDDLFLLRRTYLQQRS
jgi:flagellar export protein FliJ